MVGLILTPSLLSSADKDKAKGISRWESARMVSEANTSSGVPLRISFPSLRTNTSSANLASSMSWVMERIVNSGLACLTFSIKVAISFFPLGSSMAVASSKMTRSGCMAKTPAIATRCFCPPDKEVGSRSRNSFIPAKPAYSSMIPSISEEGTCLFSNPKAMSSATVLPTNWLSGF